MRRGHFQDIFNNVSNLTDKQFVEDRINCISAHHITTPGDIEEALNDLKSGKCARLDNTHAEHLKNASNVYSMVYYLYCARLWWSTDYCKHNFIKNKSGDKHNYRPIAITYNHVNGAVVQQGSNLIVLHSIDLSSVRTYNYDIILIDCLIWTYLQQY